MLEKVSHGFVVFFVLQLGQNLRLVKANVPSDKLQMANGGKFGMNLSNLWQLPARSGM